MWSDEVDRVLSTDYLGDLEARPIAEVRAMRSELRTVEDKVSYLRRLVQGRLDIVVAERRRRAEGGAPADLSVLIDQLPEILSDKIHAPGPGRLPAHMVPPDDDALTTELDAIAGPRVVGSLTERSDGELEELSEKLQAFERDVSERRRELFDRIDALTAEVARRYKTGEARAESVLEEGAR